MPKVVKYSDLLSDKAEATARLARRLRSAREAAGYHTAADAARHIGANPVTYTAHENGNREYDRFAAMLYAQGFKVRPEWLLFGIGDTVGENGVNVPELNTNTFDPDCDFDEWMKHPADLWSIPEAYVTDELRMKPDQTAIIQVSSDWMDDVDDGMSSLNIKAGSRVLIDLSDTRPSPPGTFAVSDGIGLFVSDVTVDIRDDKKVAVLTPRNKRHKPIERDFSLVRMIGRVKASLSRY